MTNFEKIGYMELMELASWLSEKFCLTDEMENHFCKLCFDKHGYCRLEDENEKQCMYDQESMIFDLLMGNMEMYEFKMKSVNDATCLKVRSLVSGFNLTAGKVYAVLNEYDSVYELQCDSGRFCRPKEFFEEVSHGETN